MRHGVQFERPWQPTIPTFTTRPNRPQGMTRVIALEAGMLLLRLRLQHRLACGPDAGHGSCAVVLYRTSMHYFEMYTASEPNELPKIVLTDEQRKEVVDRFQAFRDAVEAKTHAAPLVLSGDDLNALVQESPKLKDHVYLSIEDDKIKVRVSLPLDDLFETSLTRGRYLNGEAELQAAIKDGALTLVVDSISVDGKPLPDEVREFLGHPNIVLDFDKDLKKHPERRDLLREIESFEIKDGKVVITSRNTKQQEDDDDKESEDAKSDPDPSPVSTP